MALSTTSLAKVTAAQGDTTTARELYEESVLLAQKAADKLNIASALEGLASVVATQGVYTWAARLWGAAEALREAIGAPIPPVERTHYEQVVTEVRRQLRNETFAVTWAEGRSMTPEQAFAAHGPVPIPTPIAAEPSSPPPAKPPPTYPNDLTQREVEVLRLIAAGLSNQEIADRLVISERTVNSHLVHIFNKLGVNSRAAATAFAIRQKLAQ